MSMKRPEGTHSMTKKYDVIVVGAGAAGMLVAGYAAQNGRNVALIERNARPGRKIMITGKGRCNLTNNCTPDEFIKSVKTNPRFMFSAINTFTPQDTMDLFEKQGVPLKTERGNRVFPQSDKAVDIVDALSNFSSHKNVSKINERVVSLFWEEGILAGVVCENGGKIHAEKIVVATGGLSYPATGSTGDGYTLAKQAGHIITDTRPSLVPIICYGKECSDMMGLSLKNVTLTLSKKGAKKPVYSAMGEMLFTHFGLSGPLVLSASAHINGDLRDYIISIDLKPALTEEQLDKRLLRDFEQAVNKDFINSLGELLPKKMIPTIAKRSGIPFSLKVNQITKEQRIELVNLFKNFVIEPKDFRPIDEAVITSGGVSVKEVNPKTMESKISSGLYFVGEVLDLDAYTGGYNLQIAFSTAYMAAMDL